MDKQRVSICLEDLNYKKGSQGKVTAEGCSVVSEVLVRQGYRQEGGDKGGGVEEPHPRM